MKALQFRKQVIDLLAVLDELPDDVPINAFSALSYGDTVVRLCVGLRGLAETFHLEIEERNGPGNSIRESAVLDDVILVCFREE